MIGVFDSGVGGLTVLTEIRKVLPRANLTYVADRAHAPYGTRSLSEVESHAADVAAWLVDRGATCLVVACNTASAAALESLRERNDRLAIVGMEPAVKPAALATRSNKVAVLATAATFQGRLFESVVARFAPDTDVLTEACPQWVELVERGEITGPEAEQHVAAVVEPLVEAGADTFVLACTHFSFLRPIMSQGRDIKVFDPAPAVAAQTARVAPDTDGAATTTLAASGDTKEFGRLAAALVSMNEPVIPFAS